MKNSWRQFWSNEESIIIFLCLVGIVFGLMTGITIKEWKEYLPLIEILSDQIPSPISFGASVGLATQIVSILLSWVILCLGTELYHNRIIWLLIGLPMGILIPLNVFSGYLVAIGFVIPYILAILLSWIVMLIVGWHTMHLLWLNAMSLLPLYIASTGIIWLMEFGKSIL
jgi:hypothetical protein